MKFKSSIEDAEEVGEAVRDESEDEEEEEIPWEDTGSVAGKGLCRDGTSTWSFVMTAVRLNCAASRGLFGLRLIWGDRYSSDTILARLFKWSLIPTFARRIALRLCYVHSSSSNSSPTRSISTPYPRCMGNSETLMHSLSLTLSFDACCRSDIATYALGFRLIYARLNGFILDHKT
jgi:hypothetical protein